MKCLLVALDSFFLSCLQNSAQIFYLLAYLEYSEVSDTNRKSIFQGLGLIRLILKVT